MAKRTVLDVMVVPREGGVCGRTARLGEDRRLGCVAVRALEGREVEWVGGGEEGGIGGREVVVGVVDGNHVHRQACFSWAEGRRCLRHA